MAKAARRRLKVFQVHLGFFDVVVAAPSQAAALRAWGTRRNLFANGEARVTDDPQAVAAALAHPETPLKRAVGSADPFAVEAAHLPKVPDAPKTKAAPKPAAAPAKPHPRPDRSALDAAEAALRRLDEDRKREEAALRRRQADLDAEREAAQATYVDARRAAAAAVAAARRAFDAKGGRI